MSADVRPLAAGDTVTVYWSASGRPGAGWTETVTAVDATHVHTVRETNNYGSTITHLGRFRRDSGRGYGVKLSDADAARARVGFGGAR